MSDDEKITYVSEIEMADDNVVQVFELVSSSLRGRVIRIGDELDNIIKAHKYHNVVNELLSEVIVTAIMLASVLKYEGIFTLQIQGDGPIKMMVCDVTSSGDIRACSTFDENLDFDDLSVGSLGGAFGKGYMAFTVDNKGSDNRYQGIVEIKGDHVADAVQHYFNQSEQIGTGIKIKVSNEDDKWRAGALMLQNMPEDGANEEQGIGNIIEDDWRRAMVLMGTCTDEELIDKDLHSNILLRRLFHEEGVKVYDPYSIQAKCRCSGDKVENVLALLSDAEKNDMVKDGNISIVCEFCSKEYLFDGNREK